MGSYPNLCLKDLPKFIGEGSKILSDHLQDVVDVCLVHGFTDQNVALRFLATYFQGKELYWLCNLEANAIGTWD